MHSNKTKAQLLTENKKLNAEFSELKEKHAKTLDYVESLEKEVNKPMMAVRLSQRTRVEKLKAGYAVTLHGENAKEFDGSLDSVIEAICKPINETIDQGAAGSDFRVVVIVE